MRVNNVQPLVFAALVDKPETRKDDFLLILEVMRHYVTTDMSLCEVLKHHVELGLPSFASIIRIRRILQAKYPDLVDKPAAEVRAEEEKEFKQYALDNK